MLLYAAGYLLMIILDLALLSIAGLIVFYMAYTIGLAVATITEKDNWATKLYKKRNNKKW